MPWNEPGGDDKDPWSKGKSKDQSSRKSGDNIEDITRKMNDKFGGLFGNKNSNGSGDGPSGTVLALVAVALFVVWMATGFYTVEEGARGVEFRFGKFTRITEPGPHWQLPKPINTVEKVNVDNFRNAKGRSHMLTKDENIVDLEFVAQYKVNNIEDYLFNVYLPDDQNNPARGTLFQVMRSALREVAGRNTLDSILTENRAQIARDTTDVMQQILNDYGTGLQLIKLNLTDAAVPQQVKEAFDDVNKAREDLERFKLEAEKYAKTVVPVAEGQAARLNENAEAYKSKVISQAEGDASRFNNLVSEYRKAPKVTRERLYLETIEDVYVNSKKILVDTKSGNNLLYLPLNQIGSTPSTSDTAINPAISGSIEQAIRQQQNNIRNSTRSGNRESR